MNCPKCNARLVTARCTICGLDPDPESYEAGIYEDVSDDVAEALINLCIGVSVMYCVHCGTLAASQVDLC